MSKNTGPGMRIMWIPGRKKHNRKGIYSSTGKNVDYSTKRRGLNPTWSLGGSKVQQKLLKDDLIDEEGMGGSAASALLTTAAASSGIALAENLHNASVEKPHNEVVKNSEAECKIDENIDPLVGQELKKNDNIVGDVSKNLENNENVCFENLVDRKIEVTENFNFRKKYKTFEETENYCCKECSKKSFNTSKEKKAVSKVQNNIHDIEILPDDDETSVSSSNKKKRKKNKKKRNKNNKDENPEDDDKFVKCLYYTLMCCECTIS